MCAYTQRDRRIQAYLDVQNAQRFHARGVHTEIVVDDGVWIVLSRTAPSPSLRAAPQPSPEQQESGPGRAARGSSDAHQQRASLASTTAVLGTDDDDGAAGGTARADDGSDSDGDDDAVAYEDGGAERGVLGRKRKRDSLFLSTSAPAYAPIL